MDRELVNSLFNSFESIKQIIDWQEIWFARDLQKLLWYTKWENFFQVVARAKVSCKQSKQLMVDHFLDIKKLIKVALWTNKQTTRNIDDIKLSRYACYLIAQNWDPKKEEIAFAQTYFALQTRKQELVQNKLGEYERLMARKKLTATEKEFTSLMFQSGVDEKWIGKIRSAWDSIIFGGKNTKEMKEKLWIPENRALADFLPAVTIKAKDLATEVTNHNLKNQKLYWEDMITQEHSKNTRWVREYLEKSWIYPERLPAEKDLKIIEREKLHEEKKGLELKPVHVEKEYFFPLPDSVDILDKIVQIIKSSPWEKEISVGWKKILVSQEGIYQILEVIWNKNI